MGISLHEGNVPKNLQSEPKRGEIPGRPRAKAGVIISFVSAAKGIRLTTLPKTLSESMFTRGSTKLSRTLISGRYARSGVRSSCPPEYDFDQVTYWWIVKVTMEWLRTIINKLQG